LRGHCLFRDYPLATPVEEALQKSTQEIAMMELLLDVVESPTTILEIKRLKDPMQSMLVSNMIT
jgi:hypothetical protein